jgi:sugar lactone lactonase YvrE
MIQLSTGQTMIDYKLPAAETDYSKCRVAKRHSASIKFNQSSVTHCVNTPFRIGSPASHFAAWLTLILPTAWFSLAQAQTINTIAGGPPCRSASATAMALTSPAFITGDNSGNVYFVSGNAVCKMTASGEVEPIAGNGTSGYSGDSGPATSAQLNGPQGLAIDNAGNLYISDSYNSVVRKVTPAGTISTYAGNSQINISDVGDGGPAVLARLNIPQGLAADGAGNLYIADGWNFRIRKVSPEGTIVTVAGNGQSGYSGDLGPATAAKIGLPMGLAVDSTGNLYFADQIDNLIRKVSSNGTISTFAGNAARTGYSGDNGLSTNATLSAPENVATDNEGNVYIADTYDNVIRKVNTAGIITTVAGTGTAGYSGDGGLARTAQLHLPGGVAIDDSGNLFIADTSNARIRKVSQSGIISTVAGNAKLDSGDNGPADIAQLDLPKGVAFDNGGNLYVVEGLVVRKVTPAGTISTVAGDGNNGYSGDGGSATAAQFSNPSDIAIDSAGNLYIADTDNSVIRKVTPTGTISTFAGNGSAGYSGDGGPASSAQIGYPKGVAIDRQGNLFISDWCNNVVRKVSSSGIIDTFAGNGSPGHTGDGGAATAAELNQPQHLAIDSEGNLYIADGYLVREVATSGIISTVAGNINNVGYSGDGGQAINATLTTVDGLAFDATGNLYIVDEYNNVVRRVTTDGIINTVAGNHQQGYSGDGGAAVNAEFNGPQGIAIDASSNVYVADTNNNAIREITFSNAAASVSLTTQYSSSLAGQSVPLVAAVSGNSPTGTVTFSDQATATVLCSSVPVRRLATTGPFTAYCATPAGSGALATGAHTLVATYSGDVLNAAATASLDEDVNSMPGFNPNQFGLTGSWYTPDTSGQGLVANIYKDFPNAGAGTLFAGWYTYSTDGTTLDWYTLQGTVSQNQASATVNIYATSGGKFNTAAETAPVTNTAIGTATITFGDCQHMTITYNFTDGSNRIGTMPLQRLDINNSCSAGGDVGGYAGTSQQYSVAWYDPSTSGQGFVFDLSPQQDVFFAGWYTYDLAGNRLWMAIQGPWSGTQTQASDLAIIQSTGGVFNDPALAKIQQVGSASVAFSSCTQATLTYVFAAGPLAGQTGSISLQTLGPTPAGCQ